MNRLGVNVDVLLSGSTSKVVAHQVQDRIISSRNDGDEITKYKKIVRIIHYGSKIQQELFWNTGVKVDEYLKLERENTSKEFQLAVIPESYFIRKMKNFPEESCLKSLSPKLEKLNFFEFIQFCLLAKRLNRRMLGTRVYIPIGLTLAIETMLAPNETAVKDLVYPVYEDKGLADRITAAKSGLTSSSIPTITFLRPTIKFALEEKFFLAKVF